MMRSCAWIAVIGTILTASLALAQGPTPNPALPSPFGNPGLFGYPGYPMPPYGAPLPMSPGSATPNLPYGYPRPLMPMGPGGMMPVNPYGNLPAPVPADPRQPIGPSLPGYDAKTAKPGATEPYMMLPDNLPTKSKPASKEAPPAPTPVPAEPFMPAPDDVTPTGYVQQGPPSEPYTMYEGRRYLAEVKHDDTRIWGQANFIHWWTSHSNTPPLVTTGGVGGGVLGNPDTVILLGNGSIGPTEFSGVQGTIGMWLDPERLQSLEFGGFWLGKNSRQSRVGSDANGNPPLTQPVILGGAEAAILFAFPGVGSGSFSASNIMDFHSLEVNFARNLFRLNGVSIDSFAGFRYLYLHDALDLNQNLTALPAPAALLAFNGVAQPPGANFLINDSFNITNRFYGGQIGGRIDWTHRSGFDLGAIVKIGFGATAHVADINGSSTLNVNGTSTTAAGGVLALPSNIGRSTSTDFTVVPEVTATAGYQITSCLRLQVGYNFLFWSQVQRAGDQINRNIDLTQAPTSPFFVPGAVGTNPVFPAARTSFWAQGINVGLELKF